MSRHVREKTSDLIDRAFVTTPEGQLHYRGCGSSRADCVPLLLIAPCPRSGFLYEPLLPLMSGWEGAVVAIDLPGLGESYRPPSLPNVAAHADAALSVVAHLGWSSCAVMGEGLGGCVAVEAALRRPGMVDRLALADPPAPLSSDRASASWPAWPPPPRPDGGHLMDIWTGSKDEAPLADRLEGLIDLYRGGSNAGAVTSALASYPLEQALARVTQPVTRWRGPRSGGRAAFAALLEDFATRRGA